MLRKFATALVATVVLGLPSIAIAEDSSSSFDSVLRGGYYGGYGGYYGGYGGYGGGYATGPVALYGYGPVARYRGWGGHYRRF